MMGEPGKQSRESGRIRTCLAHELDTLTQVGWRLREILEEEEQVGGLTYQTNEMHPQQGYSQSLQKTSPPVVLRRALFILERSRDVEIEALREAAKEASIEAKAADARATEVEKVAKDACVLVETYTNEIVVVRKELHRVSCLSAGLRSSNARLETDIAKLRKEIGESRFREILGEGKT